MSNENNHEHKEYSHIDGLFCCQCGAVRLAAGVWADPADSERLKKAASRKTRKLFSEHGTSVDAHSQRLP
jgi:hypothetical protein